MSYRTTEQERWKQFDFVVGYEVKTTQNGHHVEDMCDMLAGKNPKTFKFTGWHPQCMCHCIPILKTEDEFWADDDTKSVNEVEDVPQGFKDWIRDNSDRIESAEKRGNLPYFIRDNKDDVENALNPKNDKSDISLFNRMAIKDGRVENFFDIDNKDRNRLVSTIHEVNKKTNIFPQSFDITITDDLNDGTLMAWREGELRISNAIYRMDDKTTFCPARDLKSAFNKLKRKEQLTFTEEYSIESLFHESVHSRYLSGKFEANPLSDIMMEGCTQLYARERYTKILKHFKASACHYDEIRLNGYGYRDIVDILRPYFTKDGELQIGELINIAIGEEDGIKKLNRKFKELNVSTQERWRIISILRDNINDRD